MAEARGRPRTYDKLYDEEMLRDLYLEQDVPISEIARMNGCSRSTVIYVLERYGLRDEKLEI